MGLIQLSTTAGDQNSQRLRFLMGNHSHMEGVKKLQEFILLREHEFRTHAVKNMHNLCLLMRYMSATE